MILAHGKVIHDCEQSAVIDALPAGIAETLSSAKPLEAETVINACDRLATRVLSGEFDDIIQPLLNRYGISYNRFTELAQLFSREGLEYKCRVELPDVCLTLSDNTRSKRYPLGVLMHIAAGNFDALPAYSVIEGLLAGNINILKLPSGDSGLSVRLLSELCLEEQSLTDYIYVFDVPSTETETLVRLAKLADGVVVWGGDDAVRAARNLADPETKIIAWGHKLSFAYISGRSSDAELTALAIHICDTEQTLCSSCQGIFIDTDSRTEQDIFAERFFGILRSVSESRKPVDFGMCAKNAINMYTEKLEKNKTGHRLFSGGCIGVVASDDSNLTLSYMFRNVWVKRLPREHIIQVLKPYRGHLQTVGLICPDSERAEFAERFALAGAVRITRAGEMSRTLCGEAHDGTYALREYSRIVETV